MKLQKISAPVQLVMFGDDKPRYYKSNNPFAVWQKMFSQWCRTGKLPSEYRTNNSVKVYPWDDEHNRFYKMGAYFRKKPSHSGGFHITYYPYSIDKTPLWVAISRSDKPYSEWVEWCRDNAATASVLNANYKMPYSSNIVIENDRRRASNSLEQQKTIRATMESFI